MVISAINGRAAVLVTSAVASAIALAGAVSIRHAAGLLLKIT